MSRKKLYVFFFIAVFLLASIFLILFPKFRESRTEYKVDAEASLLFRVFYKSFMDDSGGIYTNLRNDVPKVSGTATGHQMLSESTGLMMLYALRNGDQMLFDQQFSFLNKHLITKTGLVRWMVDLEDDSHDVSSNASIDDLRIIWALREADRMWGQEKGRLYSKKAEKISVALQKHNVTGGILTDYFDWKSEQPADSVTSSYLDLKTIWDLAENDEDWKPVYESSLQILKEAALSNGLYKKTYKWKTGDWEPIESVHLVDTLYCAYHLAEVGKDVSPTIRLIETRMEAEGKLHGRLHPDGTSAGDLESPAVYALAIRLLDIVNPKHPIIEKLKQRLQDMAVSDSNSMYQGAFVHLPDLEGYSFDQLQSLLVEKKEQLL
ncbi:glycosyl hydrolase family 8 [Cohnella luojiensis]|uniref:Glycosyl hydrolase n=1 Tax=Cohnella luojiensis TaxID=652876 RepID=A0A4Y8M976_9BACL|nr:glycosyl hydrolase family 8 [Cohnella luojiensis]TFE31685.1 hypothetical protein E2980_00995 [Cohnella luojiensis]